MTEPDYISNITIRGFKSVKNVENLELRPINVLVGANGSGKSNFIEAFAFLNAIREGRLQHYVRRSGGAEKLLFLGSKRTHELHFSLSFRRDSSRYGIQLIPTSGDSLAPASEWIESVMDSSEGRLQPIGQEAGISGPPHSPHHKHIQELLSWWRIYHFEDTSPMKLQAELNSSMNMLEANGAELAAVLYSIKKYHPDEYLQIRDVVRQVAPFFDDFILEPFPEARHQIILRWRHVEAEGAFDAAMMSDGTLRFVCLATLLLHPMMHIPRAIFVDEPELGLHPYAIALLAALIKSASKQAQVIVSTQSPILLDHFDPEDVLVADLERGATSLRRLSSTDLETWLEDYSLGQLWEKNQFGGRPSHV